MFASISFTGLKSSAAFGYAAAVPFFSGRKKLAFKPGLNILFGPNGCGKSTVIKMLARTMCAEQGGFSCITQGAISENVDMFDKRSTHKVGLKIAHDGQPVVYCDPRSRIGLMGGSLDEDFVQQGLAECIVLPKRSQGQAVLSRVSGALNILAGEAPFPAAVEAQVDRKYVNDVWGRALGTVEKAMAASIDKGQPTILLDEPEANFSLVWQSRLWRRLASSEAAQRCQIIVASHSAFALGIEHANYIDFEPGFREEVEGALTQRFRPA